MKLLFIKGKKMDFSKVIELGQGHVWEENEIQVCEMCPGTCQHRVCYAFFKPDSAEKIHVSPVSLARSAWRVSAPAGLDLPTYRMGTSVR